MKKPQSSIDTMQFKPSVDWLRNEPKVKFPIAVANLLEISPHILSQHTLVTGATGSGKTHSLVLPYAEGLLSYQLPGCAPTGGVVIDPKNELINALEKLPQIKDRIRLLGKQADKTPEGALIDLKLNLFEFSKKSSLRERIGQIKALCSPTPLGGDQDKWHDMGWDFATQMLQIQSDLACASQEENPEAVDFLGGMSLVFSKNNTAHSDLISTLLLHSDEDDFVKKCDEKIGTIGCKPLSAVDGLTEVAAVDRLKNSYRKYPAEKSQGCNLDKLKAFMMLVGGSHKRLKLASEVLLKLQSNLALEYMNPFEAYSGSEDAAIQITYFIQSISPGLALLTDPGLKTFLELDPLKDFSAGSPSFSMADVLDRGDILVYQPGQLKAEADNILGNVLRMNYVNYIQCRKDMMQPQAFIVDEWHRYVSASPVYGDNLFLSFCRSYRVMTCLCTQSVEAIETALVVKEKLASASFVVGSILNNISSRFMLRTSDQKTQEVARNVFPFERNHARVHVLDARPLCTLKDGEYYYVMPVARQGRSQAILQKKEHSLPVLAPLPAPTEAKKRRLSV